MGRFVWALIAPMTLSLSVTLVDPTSTTRSPGRMPLASVSPPGMTLSTRPSGRKDKPSRAPSTSTWTVEIRFRFTAADGRRAADTRDRLSGERADGRRRDAARVAAPSEAISTPAPRSRFAAAARFGSRPSARDV